MLCSLSKPDWKLDNPLASRKMAQRRYRRRRHYANKLILKKEIAVVHPYCVHLRSTQWAAFYASFDTCAGMMLVGKAIHVLTGIRDPRELFQFLAIFLQTTASETAEPFASHFAGTSAATAPHMTNVNMAAVCAEAPLPYSVVPLACPFKLATSCNLGHCLFKQKSPLDAPFKISWLDCALGRLSCEFAAGPDASSNQALRNLQNLSKPWLLDRLDFFLEHRRSTRDLQDSLDCTCP